MSKLLNDLKEQIFSLEVRGYIQEPKKLKNIKNHVEMLEDIVDDAIKIFELGSDYHDVQEFLEDTKRFKEKFYNKGIGTILWIQKQYQAHTHTTTLS